jgi:uncharacterized membrane protein (DUF373 family)
MRRADCQATYGAAIVDGFIETAGVRVKYMNLLNRVVLYIEGAVTVLLVVLAALGVVDIVLKMLEVTRADGFMTPEGITRTIDTVLVVFIVIELIRIAVSYMQHKNVIGTVLEAGLVAVVRKLVIFESGEGMLEKAIALAILILAVGVTWYLLQRGSLCADDAH